MRLYKRGNIWWLIFEKDCKRYRISTKTSNRKEAKAFLDAIETARRMPTFDDAVNVLRIIYGDDGGGGRMRLKGAWEEYVKVAESVGRVSNADTMRHKRQHFNEFVRWAAGNRPRVKAVTDVDGATAAAYAAHLLAEGGKSKTRINKIGTLSTMWRMLAKKVSGLNNPWTDLRPANTDGERIAAFTPEQEAAVMAAAEKVGKDWRPVCVVARHTGLRYEDVALLRRADVDMEKGVISVTPNKTKKHAISVSIPMIAEVRDALSAQPDTGDYFFPAHAHNYGDRSKKGSTRLSFREVLIAAGLYGKGNYTFHSWRHTAATRLAAAGASIETRKLILGHTVDATARHYDQSQHLEEKRSALERASGHKTGTV